MMMPTAITKLISLLALAIVLPSTEARSDTACLLGREGSGVFRWDGSSWQKLGGAANAVFGGGFALVATNPDNTQAFRWTVTDGWAQIGGGGSSFAITNNAIYALTSNRDAVFKWSNNGQNWQQIGGPAGNLYAGGDNLFATDPANTGIYHYLHDDVWEKVGAGGADFAVDGNGVLYGLNPPMDKVFQWSGVGQDWSQIGGAASRLFAGGIGMFAVNPDNTAIWKHNSGSDWQQVGGGGSHFTVTDEGLYGVGLGDLGIYRWTGSGQDWQNLGGGGTPQIVPCP
ncbi:hypothetical protein GQ53DRAFT_883108 [Thozetella sp. PMI_491]|nr:hypothetical protein GQ53DRAFT_883108 [Thozetella sp. PMI_491]